MLHEFGTSVALCVHNPIQLMDVRFALLDTRKYGSLDLNKANSYNHFLALKLCCTVSLLALQTSYLMSCPSGPFFFFCCVPFSNPNITPN